MKMSVSPRRTRHRVLAITHSSVRKVWVRGKVSHHSFCGENFPSFMMSETELLLRYYRGALTTLLGYEDPVLDARSPRSCSRMHEKLRAEGVKIELCPWSSSSAFVRGEVLRVEGSVLSTNQGSLRDSLSFPDIRQRSHQAHRSSRDYDPVATFDSPDCTIHHRRTLPTDTTHHPRQSFNNKHEVFPRLRFRAPFGAPSFRGAVAKQTPETSSMSSRESSVQRRPTTTRAESGAAAATVD